ncbi:hypothetical protein RBH88_03335 [Aminobacterium sp. MB27-C1]|uniref:hypothetical protein n=1 Tax=Aminobacterium sp. MB27-C1 TaxID=3070661 RepID=UPI0027DBEAB5|nr:hypothetical protein [Aminobacterium sp. MB27-C1]WMI72147.1 hypothetical protein RBH88_03335 [Aminobacterium sp. MB27-C1]
MARPSAKRWHETKFTLRYVPINKKRGSRINAQDFCKSIDGLARTIKAAAKAIHKEEVSLEIEGHVKKGSVVVSLIEVSKLSLLPMIDYIIINPASLIHLIRFLKKTQYRIEEILPDGLCRIITEDNREYKTSTDSAELYRDKKVMQHFKTFLSATSTYKEEITTGDKLTKIELTSSDYENIPDITEEEYEERRIILQPIITNVIGQDNGWRFDYVQEGKAIHVDMEDEVFLSLIRENRIILRSTDKLEVNLKITKKFGNKTTYRYTVTKVCRYNNKSLSEN